MKKVHGLDVFVLYFSSNLESFYTIVLLIHCMFFKFEDTMISASFISILLTVMMWSVTIWADSYLRQVLYSVHDCLNGKRIETLIQHFSDDWSR